MAMTVPEYAASEMRYLCLTGDYGGVGYSQSNRWTWYHNTDDAGWRTGPGEADCSSAVGGAINFAFHNVFGSAWDDSLMLPTDERTWTGALPDLLPARGFMDIGGTWTGSTPDGGFREGDVLTSDGHVTMAVRDKDGSFDPWDPAIAELWIDSAGSILGSDGGDGSPADDNGWESRLIAYSDHPTTAAAAWFTCWRYQGADTGGGGEDRGSTRPDHHGSMVGIDISDHQAGMDIGATGAEAVFVKATEGSGYVDPSFHRHADEVLRLGKPLGLYHFTWNSANTLDEEVDTFLNAVRPYLGRAVLCLDWEDPDGWHDVAWAEAWLDRVKAATGISPIVYMSASVAAAYSWESVASKYWLWVADYRAGRPEHLTHLSYPDSLGHGWWLIGYQYTGTGRVPGFDHDVDLDTFYTNTTYWNWLAGGQGEEDELMASEAVELLRKIHDDLTYGEAGVKQAGHVIYALEKLADKVAALDEKVTTISDALTPGKENVKAPGALYDRVRETRNATLAIQEKVAPKAQTSPLEK